MAGSTLADADRAYAGEIAMTRELEAVADALFFAKVPAAWRQVDANE